MYDRRSDWIKVSAAVEPVEHLPVYVYVHNWHYREERRGHQSSTDRRTDTIVSTGSSELLQLIRAPNCNNYSSLGVVNVHSLNLLLYDSGVCVGPGYCAVKLLWSDKNTFSVSK